MTTMAMVAAMGMRWPCRRDKCQQDTERDGDKGDHGDDDDKMVVIGMVMVGGMMEGRPIQLHLAKVRDPLAVVGHRPKVQALHELG